MSPFDGIRLGQPEELVSLQEIERLGGAQFLTAGHPELAGDDAIELKIAARSVANGSLHVIEHDGRVRGWICVEQVGSGCRIQQVSVHPAYQQQGLGTALMRFVIAGAIANGLQSVLLGTQSDVAWNQPWYEQLGFEVVDRNRWTSQMKATVVSQTAAGLDWSTRVHMRLSLSDR